MEKGRPVDSGLRNWLHALAVEHGTARAARRVGLSRGAFASACAGLPCYQGTHAQIELSHLREETREIFAEVG